MINEESSAHSEEKMNQESVIIDEGTIKRNEENQSQPETPTKRDDETINHLVL